MHIHAVRISRLHHIAWLKMVITRVTVIREPVAEIRRELWWGLVRNPLIEHGNTPLLCTGCALLLWACKDRHQHAFQMDVEVTGSAPVSPAVALPLTDGAEPWSFRRFEGKKVGLVKSMAQLLWQLSAKRMHVELAFFAAVEQALNRVQTHVAYSIDLALAFSLPHHQAEFMLVHEVGEFTRAGAAVFVQIEIATDLASVSFSATHGLASIAQVFLIAVYWG